MESGTQQHSEKNQYGISYFILTILRSAVYLHPDSWQFKLSQQTKSWACFCLGKTSQAFKTFVLVLAGGWWPGLGQSVRSSGSAELSFLQRYRPWPRLQGCLEGPGLIYKLGWHSAVGHFPITTSLGDCCGNLMWKIRSWNVTLDVINELDWDFFILWVNVSTASSWMFNIKKKIQYPGNIHRNLKLSYPDVCLWSQCLANLYLLYWFFSLSPVPGLWDILS